MKSKAAIFALTVAAVGYSLSAGTSAFALDSQADGSASASDDDSATVMIVGPGMTDVPILAQAGRPGGFAGGMSPRMCEMKSEHMKAFMADLNLTDAQIESMAQLKSDFKDKVEPIHAKLHSLKRQCHHLLLQPQIDTDAVAKVRSQMEAQRKILDSYLTDYLIAKTQVLTPDQRHKIELAMDKRELWHHGHGHHHHGGFRGSWS